MGCPITDAGDGADLGMGRLSYRLRLTVVSFWSW
jgi:hypothetical protein